MILLVQECSERGRYVLYAGRHAPSKKHEVSSRPSIVLSIYELDMMYMYMYTQTSVNYMYMCTCTTSC